MRNNLLISVLVIISLIVLLTIVSNKNLKNNKSVNINSPSTTPDNESSLETTTPTLTAQPKNPTFTPSPTSTSSQTTRVRAALIALDTDGPVGCGDSIEFVTREIPKTTGVLRAAIQALLALKTQYYGESGFYNSLYQSNLTISSVTLSNGTATIHLNGTISLGGTCDSPRLKAQIEQTALQFSSLQRVNIFINGKDIDEALSQK